VIPVRWQGAPASISFLYDVTEHRRYAEDLLRLRDEQALRDSRPLAGNREEQRATLEARQPGRDFDYSGRLAGNDALQYQRISGEPVFDAEGKFTGYRGLVRDVSEERRLQEQLHEMQKLEAIGQLTGGLAHDFNNLLGIVLGNLDLIEDALPGGERLRRRLDTARHAALRGAEVTRSLLVADDEPEPCELASTWLESTGHSVVAVCCSSEALAQPDQWVFDLPFTDVVMPGGIDGPALASAGGRDSRRAASPPTHADGAPALVSTNWRI
jgi:CheY-like chemotaxis protein